MIKRLARIGADESGTSAIELGLLAPILGTLLVGMIDLSSAYSAKLKLVQGAQRGVERIQRFGVGVPTKTDEVSLKSEVADGAGVTVDKVTVTSWLECTSSTGTVTILAYNGSCSTGQSFSRNVRIDAQGTYTPMFSMKWAGANADGTFTLLGRAGIRVQ
jgi:Flp pilus assembly protein TadG